MDRDTIFISHASPDDNEFVGWLGNELTARGYSVWADIFHLKGGTPFWTTIEDVLRQRTAKVVFVVSRRSVDPQRTGVRNELSVADGLRKSLKDPEFIVPVRIDDTPFDELPIQVHQLNTIDFSKDRAKALPALIETLQASTVARNAVAGPAEVSRSGAPADRTGESAIGAGHDSASIAVLPFDNIGSDPEQAYFADGVVEDIINALSRFRTFAVVARSSSFVYRGKSIDVRAAATELGVRYVLEGSVRRGGAKLRVTAELVDASTGRRMWAEKFDGALDDVFDFQDSITEKVIGFVEPHIRKAEIERARSKRPENVDAYDLYLQALPHFYGFSDDDYARAIELLESAIMLDTAYAPAIAYAAFAYEKRWHTGAPPLRGHDSKARSIDLARMGLKLGQDDPVVLAICGYILLLLAKEAAAGLATVGRAREANPNNVVVLNNYGISNVIAGDLNEAISAYLHACELSPGAPEIYESLTGIGTAYLLQQNYSEALKWLLRSEATFNEWQATYWALGATYAHLGRIDEAHQTVAKLLARVPRYNLAMMEQSIVGFDGRYEIMVSGLRKAGLSQN